jgi:ATP-dependent protease ClpP protease subunit
MISGKTKRGIGRNHPSIGLRRNAAKTRNKAEALQKMKTPIGNGNDFGNILTNLVGGGDSYSSEYAHVHEYYINGGIEGPEKYTQWFHQIRNAKPTDIIKLHLNSFGGDMFTAIQFMHCFNQSSAHLHVSVEGACMSAATLLFLIADDWEISPHSMFMFHNYSSGTFGKGGEMYDSITHERKWSETLFRDVYQGFLDDDEIKSILDNKDIWMDAEEVVERLGSRAEFFESLRAAEEAKKKPAKKKAAKKKAAKKKAASKKTD